MMNKSNSRIALPLVLVSLFSLSGCATTMHKNHDVMSQLTNLQTGEVIELKMGKTDRNRSSILKSSPVGTGETFTGDFTTSGRSNIATGVSAGYYSGGGWSLGVDLLKWLGSNQRGNAIIKGDKGTIIDVSYTASQGGIQGEGIDNNGVRYRFSCCDTER